MSNSAGIGQSIRVKGEIVAQEPFLITGNVEGTVSVNGHTLTVAEGATVDATVTADAVVVQGNVKGKLAAVNKVVIQPTAVVDGELSAPSISIADGAIIHGKVETTGKTAARS